MRVLVVEDDAALCDVFAEFLRVIGHEPLIAHTAERALDTLHAERPDAVLLDICLPGMSGLDFLKLQTVRELGVPIVVISGWATESQAQECLRSGAFDFIGKPVPLRRLEEVLACFDSRPSAAASAMEPPAERRHAPRAPVALPVRVHEDDGADWDSTTVDLSASGVKLRARGSTRSGRTATLSITLPEGGRPLEIASVLVRADLDGYAFHFVNLADWQLERLRELVQRSLSSPPVPVAPHLRILHLIGQAMTATLDFDEVLRVALDALTQVTGHEISSLHLLSPDGATLRLVGDRGLRPRLREITRVVPTGHGVIGRVAASGRTLYFADVRHVTDFMPSAGEAVEQEGVRAFVCVPIPSRGRILGVLSLGRRAPEPFTQSEISLVEASANQIGLVLENAQLYSEIRGRLDDLRLTEARLIESERLSTVGKLAAGVAHETRNRLMSILGQAQLLLAGSDGPLRTRERLDTIVGETSRAAEMLRNLLRFSGGHSAERRSCDLRPQVRWVLDLKGHELERDGIEVVVDLKSVPAVLADENQIRQVLLNLVQNAHHALATHAGERVLTVRLSESVRHNVLLEVLDTGPGIHPGVLPRIFDAFSTTKPPDEGSGLGLWVSSAIIERHHGSLRAQNRPSGGAAFAIELPAEASAVPDAAPA